MADTRRDTPPNSRLFILAGRGITEETYRTAFEKYGKVENIWIVKDRRSGEDKGITYIKYSKSSEAALAVEEMNGVVLDGNSRPLKIMIASSTREGSTRDPKEEEKLLRLFLIIPKGMKEEDIRREFEEFGEIDYITILKDKEFGANKGFAYVKFYKPYHAALAFEGCNPDYKPKFADPKGVRRERDNNQDFGDDFGGGRDRGRKRGRYDEDFGYYGDDRMDMMVGRPEGLLGMGPQLNQQSTMINQAAMLNQGIGQGPMDLLQTYAHGACQRLHITAPIGLTQNYLTRLCSLIPGLEYCDLNEMTGVAYVRYANAQCAAYARDRLDGFEYPIGSRLLVKFADAPSAPELESAAEMSFDKWGTGPPDSMQKAAEVLERAGINPQNVLQSWNSSAMSDSRMERPRYCNLMLPAPQPLKAENTLCEQRLFIVCQPSGIPERVLRDAFCRFGNLIDVYLLPGRNYGYAKFGSKESAMRAIQQLHGQSVAGQRLKVLEAESPRDDERSERSRR
ncbi:hypothetical protein ScPMuIL_015270 [Solemya velum]